MHCIRQVVFIDQAILSMFLESEFESCSPNGAVRLVNGTETEGRVEYCHNGQWMAICGSLQDEEIAVICRQLGYTPYGGII